MADDNKIGLEALFENADFQRGISEYNSSISDASKNTEASSSAMSEAWAGLSSAGLIAWEALAAGIVAVTAELGFAAAAAMDTEDVLARMEFVVANVGERTGVTSQDVLALADSISQVVPIDDEVITSAITMGLTFDGVNKDNIQPLIAAAADLATFTGKDLPGTMKELALAISDPDRAMRLFKDANVTLTDAEKKTLQGFKDIGDTAGATAFILDELKNKGIIGLGEVMGDTAKGKLTIMQTALGNLQEALGSGLLDALKGVFDKITAFANDPKTITFLTELGNKIGDVAEDIISRLPDVFSVIDGIVTWLSNNKPIILGILAAIGVAMLAFAATSAAAAVTAIAGLAPIIAIMAAVGAAVALLTKAWTEDWGGIQGKVKKAWKQMEPVFKKLNDWIKVNLPKALKVLADFWEKTLLPAIKTVTIWIIDNVLPLLVELVKWYGENIPKAIKTTSDFFTKTLIPAVKAVADWIENTLIPILKEMRDWFQTHIVAGIQALVSVISGALTSALNSLSNIWKNVLLPALTAVWNFINNNIIPIFNAVANLMDAVVGLAVRVLAGLWQNVLAPALQTVWNWISNNIIPIFHSVSSTMSGALSTATTALSNLWNNVLKPAIQAVWDKLKPFADFLSNVLKKAFDDIRTVIQWVIDKINGLADAINKLSLPDWLTPGSPTPFEMGLRGINEQLAKLTQAALPAVRHQMEILGTVRDVAGTSGRSVSNTVTNSNQSTRNYLFGTQVNLPGPSGLIETLQGLT